MDEGLEDTREWLDRRYARADEHGVYTPHQPIYGFGAPPYDQGVVPRLTRTARILDLLAALEFSTFADVSAAEGYLPWLVRRAFGAEVVGSDLSPVAGQRMTGIFGVPALAADVHRLPFSDGTFDVVVCSQTLEHVDDPLQAARELLRVAVRAVLITVPHEDLHDGGHHGAHDHIHEFDLTSFDALRSDRVRVVSFPVLAPVTRRLGALVDGYARPMEGRVSRRLVVRATNLLGPMVHRVAGLRLAKVIIERDRTVVSELGYETVFALLLKDGATFDADAAGPGVGWLMKQTVPRHVLGRTGAH